MFSIRILILADTAYSSVIIYVSAAYLRDLSRGGFAFSGARQLVRIVRWAVLHGYGRSGGNGEERGSSWPYSHGSWQPSPLHRPLPSREAPFRNEPGPYSSTSGYQLPPSTAGQAGSRQSRWRARTVAGKQPIGRTGYLPAGTQKLQQIPRASSAGIDRSRQFLVEPRIGILTSKDSDGSGGIERGGTSPSAHLSRTYPDPAETRQVCALPGLAPFGLIASGSVLLRAGPVPAPVSSAPSGWRRPQ